MARRIAIILRGPMGVGKSAVADFLCRKLQAGTIIVLDTDWFPGQSRYSGGQGRYRDLVQEHDVIVAELGCGEPVDLNEVGATRAATEWFNLLQEQGREVFVFKLWSSWPTIHAHMQAERSDQILWARLFYHAYDSNLDIVSLPHQVQKQEHLVTVDGKLISEIADEILKLAGFPE